MEIELLVFSGRENPRWVLTDVETRQLTRLVDALPPGPPPPEPPGLGYGGFLVTISGDRGELDQTMIVYQGARIGAADVGDTYRDDAGLEQWLITMARQRGHGELLDALGR